MDDFLLMNQKNCKKLIYHLYMALGLTSEYEDAKTLLYGNKTSDNKLEIKMKRAYDTIILISNNHQSNIDESMLKTIYYLLSLKELQEDVAIELVRYIYFPSNRDEIKKVVGLLPIIKKLLKDENQEDFIVFYFLLSIYIIFKEKNKILHIDRKSLKKYVELIKENKLEELDNFYLKTIINQDYISQKKYYKELVPITSQEIYQKLIENKEFIKEEYKIEHIILYGSFAKDTNHINSDIDMLVSFKVGLTYTQRVQLRDRFKEFILVTFKRYGDVMEFANHINEKTIKEVKNSLYIF